MKQFPLYILMLMSSAYLNAFTSFKTVKRMIAGPKQMTFLTYMAADNNLDSMVEQDLNEMMRVGTNENINILVYLNGHTDNGTKVTKKLVIMPGEILQIGDNEVRDSGIAATVIEAGKWACSDFPSSQLVIDFWDHGSGSLNRNLRQKNLLWAHPQQEMKAVCYDDTTGNVLKDVDLAQALSAICTFRGGKKIDVIAFDACLMADVEVAYTLAPYAAYLTASQQTIPGQGYGYTAILSQAARQATPTRDFAIAMPPAYKKEYTGNDESYTLSTIDLTTHASLVTNINLVADYLTTLLKDKSDKSLLKTAIAASTLSSKCVQFEGIYFDLGNFYENLSLTIKNLKIKNTAIKTKLLSALQDGLSKIKSCVLSNVYGRSYKKTCGLSIYISRTIDRSYTNLIWSKETKWLSFLTAYSQS